jgi:hypothetical protein
VFRKFIEFSIYVWKLERNDVTAKFCADTINSLGQIGCAHTGRKTLYRDNGRMVRLIEEYVKIMQALTAPGTIEFYDTFLKHTGASQAIRRASIKRMSVRRPVSVIVQSGLGGL